MRASSRNGNAARQQCGQPAGGGLVPDSHERPARWTGARPSACGHEVTLHDAGSGWFLRGKLSSSPEFKCCRVTRDTGHWSEFLCVTGTFRRSETGVVK